MVDWQNIKNKRKWAAFLLILLILLIPFLWYFVEVRPHVDNEINSFMEKTRSISDPKIKIREVANFTEEGYQQAYNRPSTDKILSSRLLFGLTNDPYFVAYFKAGACAESAALLNFYATRSGFESRIVGTNAEDHQWDEIKIKDKWVQVDPTIYYYYYTDLKNYSDYDSLWFDHPQAYTELQWYGGYSTVSVLNTGEDLTAKYCNVSTLSIKCQDCSYIKIKSENGVRYSVDKEIVNSESTFLLGKKNYTIIADKPIIPYLLVRQSNVSVSLLDQEKMNITLNPEEIQSTLHLQLLVILSFLVLLVVMVIFYIKIGIKIFREWKNNKENKQQEP
jgi:Ca2+/Na+ antiporter